MGDVVIQIGEGIASVFAFLGAVSLIAGVVAIFFPLLAVAILLCILGPLSSPCGAIYVSWGVADAAKEDVERAETKLKNRRRSLSRAEQKLETAVSELLLAVAEQQAEESEPERSLGRFEFWGRLKRSKQRFESTMQQRRFDRAKQRQNQAERELKQVSRNVTQATKDLEAVRQRRKRKLIFHAVFTTVILASVLWVLWLLPPP